MGAADPAHDLIPEELARQIPALYATENDSDAITWIKLFTPGSSWTWYIVEYDPTERLCFGLVIGLECELGYFALDELEAVHGPLGLRIERDLFWEPKTLSQCR